MACGASGRLLVNEYGAGNELCGSTLSLFEDYGVEVVTKNRVLVGEGYLAIGLAAIYDLESLRDIIRFNDLEGVADDILFAAAADDITVSIQAENFDSTGLQEFDAVVILDITGIHFHSPF